MAPAKGAPSTNVGARFIAPEITAFEQETKKLMEYFYIGLALPNDSFWVNLRPDSPDNIIDPLLAQTDIGRIMLETDVQLKKDTARMTSPETPEGKLYWDKLYKKAEELFGTENITIPTLTRPWIVPNEIIIRETKDSAYIYKATLKVMLEQDYLKGSAAYNFQDERLKQLNEYSSQLIRELIIPKLTKEVNTSKRYAELRQVYYSLILAQWFKSRLKGMSPSSLRGAIANTGDEAISKLINSNNLANLTSKQLWDKTAYFQAYQKSFKDGEYNLKEPRCNAFGQNIRSYFSGGIKLDTATPSSLMYSQNVVNPTNILGENGIRVDVAGSDGSAALDKDIVYVSSPAAVPEHVDLNLGDYLRSYTESHGQDVALLVHSVEVDHLEGMGTVFGGLYDIIFHGLKTAQELHFFMPNRTQVPDKVSLAKLPQLLFYNWRYRGPNAMWGDIHIIVDGNLIPKDDNYREIEHSRGIAEVHVSRVSPEAIVAFVAPPEYSELLTKVMQYVVGQNPAFGKPIFREKLSYEKGQPEMVFDPNKSKSSDVPVASISGVVTAHIASKDFLEEQGVSSQAGSSPILNQIYLVGSSEHKDLVALVTTTMDIYPDLKYADIAGRADIDRSTLSRMALINSEQGVTVETYEDNPYDGVKLISRDIYRNGEYKRENEPPSDGSSPVTGPAAGMQTVEQNESQTEHNGSSSVGGIDFRSLPIITQAITNLNVNVSRPAIQNLRLINLDEEFLQIQNLVKAGIEPSSERLKEYIQASCLKDNSIRNTDKVILCISDVLRQEEENCTATDPVMRDILIVLESINSPKELKEVFIGGAV